MVVRPANHKIFARILRNIKFSHTSSVWVGWAANHNPEQAISAMVAKKRQNGKFGEQGKGILTKRYEKVCG